MRNTLSQMFPIMANLSCFEALCEKLKLLAKELQIADLKTFLQFLVFQLCFCGQPAADTRVLLGRPNFDPQPNPPLSHFSLRKQGIQYFTHLCMKFLNFY